MFNHFHYVLSLTGNQRIFWIHVKLIPTCLCKLDHFIDVEKNLHSSPLLIFFLDCILHVSRIHLFQHYNVFVFFGFNQCQNFFVFPIWLIKLPQVDFNGGIHNLWFFLTFGLISLMFILNFITFLHSCQ
jgi:hypothetical protein